MSWQNTEIIKNKKPVISRLLEYGFVLRNGQYIFSADIMKDSFLLNVYIDESGTRLEVIDKATDDEYALAGNDSAVGAFVGQVRSECEAILKDIVSQCYEPDIFKSGYAKLVIEYIRNEYGAEAEFLWEKFPNNAIFREKKTQKWYAALLTVEKRKLGIDEDGTIEVIDLRESPENIALLVDEKRYFSGYHMNKKHWYTLLLDGSVFIEEIYRRIDASFDTLLNIRVRELTGKDDYAAVSRIYAESWRSAYRGLLPQSYLDSITDDEWAERLSQKERYSFVVEKAGHTIGTASCGKSRNPKFSDWGEIYAIYFLPQYTRHGYGKRLLKYVLVQLQELGYRSAFLMVLEDNVSARSFYEKSGFTLADGTTDVVIGGQPVREVSYVYQLKPGDEL